MLACAALACVVALVPAARAAEASARAADRHSSARLIDAGPAEHQALGVRLAGVELRLDPTFITYWRTPGDAGVPPTFDFAASQNLKEARVEYPAPHKFDEAGAEAFGYDKSVVFPLLVTPLDPARPVMLDIALDYAVCGNICLPAKAHLRLALEGVGASDAGPLREAMAEVPQRRKVGETGPLRIDRVTPQADGGLSVEATAPEGHGTLFAEAPDGWFFRASPGAPSADGHLGFSVALVDRPASGPAPSAPMRLTLVSPAGAIEVPVRLDAGRATP